MVRVQIYHYLWPNNSCIGGANRHRSVNLLRNWFSIYPPLNRIYHHSNDKGKRVVMAHLWGSGSSEEGIHILVIGKYLKDEFKSLFPKKTFPTTLTT